MGRGRGCGKRQGSLEEEEEEEEERRRRRINVPIVHEDKRNR